MLGIHKHAQTGWYYLPWKWAQRFGHGGWVFLGVGWLWRFRNPKQVDIARANRREESRNREFSTRQWINQQYAKMREDGDYGNLPLTPAEVYDSAPKIVENNNVD